jgi:ketosteroid isomerase-like protein
MSAAAPHTPPASPTAAARAIYRSMRDRDLAAFTALVHPEIEVLQPTWLPYGGRHHGLEALLAMFRQVLALVDVGRLELVSVVGEGDHVWAEFIVQARATGEDLRVAEHWRFEDGRARFLEVWFQDPTPLQQNL